MLRTTACQEKKHQQTTKSTTAAKTNQTKTPEILIRKTNMVQMASMTQAEKNPKLDDRSGGLEDGSLFSLGR